MVSALWLCNSLRTAKSQFVMGNYYQTKWAIFQLADVQIHHAIGRAWHPRFMFHKLMNIMYIYICIYIYLHMQIDHIWKFRLSICIYIISVYIYNDNTHTHIYICIMYVYIVIPYRSYIQLFPQSNSQQNLGGGPRQEGASGLTWSQRCGEDL